MSRLRPELSDSDKPSGLTVEQALFRVYQAVSRRRGLIHGHLRDANGHACAIGCTFDEGVRSLPTIVVDKVAAYNDSFPKLSERKRWEKVMQWLRAETGQAKRKP